MSSTDRRDEYLRMAKEAEEAAAKATEETDKSAWLRIAAGYHDLIARVAQGPLVPWNDGTEDEPQAT